MCLSFFKIHPLETIQSQELIVEIIIRTLIYSLSLMSEIRKFTRFRIKRLTSDDQCVAGSECGDWVGLRGKKIHVKSELGCLWRQSFLVSWIRCLVHVYRKPYRALKFE